MPFANERVVRVRGGRARKAGGLMIAAGPGFLRDGQSDAEEFSWHAYNLAQEQTEGKAAAGNGGRLTVCLRREGKSWGVCRTDGRIRGPNFFVRCGAFHFSKRPERGHWRLRVSGARGSAPAVLW